MRPNPSLKLTRYGRHCKPGLSHSYYRLSPGLQYSTCLRGQLSSNVRRHISHRSALHRSPFAPEKPKNSSAERRLRISEHYSRMTKRKQLILKNNFSRRSH